MMKRVMVMAVAATVLAAGPAAAQKVEVSGIFGWTFSDGVESSSSITVGNERFNIVDLKDSASWGVSVGFNATDNVEVGFLFGQQLSTLAIDGTTALDLGDININTYHPYVAYNWGTPDGPVRPYLMIGLGATNYGSVDYRRLDGTPGTTSSDTQFSTTWGAGVKVFGGSNVGFRAGVQWTPTYIKSDSVGWWCDPFWGCYVVGDAKYANQFQFNGGVTFRF